jgi:hypothetical protein
MKVVAELIQRPACRDGRLAAAGRVLANLPGPWIPGASCVLASDDRVPCLRPNASGRVARQLRSRGAAPFMTLTTRPFLQERQAGLTRRLRQHELHSPKILRTYSQ